MKLRREFKLALEEDGYPQEEITEQLDHLINEEIERQDKERIRTKERDLNERNEERKLQHELELKRIDSSIESEARENAKIDNQHQKINTYDDEEDFEGWFSFL